MGSREGCSEFERLTPSGIRGGLRTRWLGQRFVHCFDVVGSTNREAHRLGQQGAPEGTVVIAEGQREGRGRLGRSWASPSGGGLYLSFVLRPGCPPSGVALLTLVAGIAVASTVRAMGFEPQLKWPNDVLIADRKVAGVLTEALFHQDRVDFVVVGVGINVNTELKAFPGDVRDMATSLRVSGGRPVSRLLLLQRLLRRQEQWYELFSAGALEKIIERWRQLDTTVGRVVEVILPQKRFVGVAEAVDDDGALLVRDKKGELVRVLAGDVVHCRVEQGPNRRS
jgi:BirA family biotin operon repressor/biotin-[acetyl-CoA-carboxylase] ligase